MTSIHIFDDMHYRFDKNTIMAGTGRTIEQYLHGRCHLFAIAMAELFPENALIECVMDYSYELERTLLSHAYIRLSNGLLVDARGIITDYDLKLYEDICENPEGAETGCQLSLEDAMAKSTPKEWGAPEENEITLLQEFIKQHRHIYFAPRYYASEGHTEDFNFPAVELDEIPDHAREAYLRKLVALNYTLDEL